MAGQPIIEAEYIQAGGADDPDLNQAFYDFAEQIKSEANSGGSIAVFEVPVDANGTPRPTTYNKTKLFTVPVGSASLDDICDRVLREFVEPGGKIMIQLLARKEGERGVKLNRMVPLRRGKNTAPQSDGTTSGEVAQLMRMMNEQRARDLAEMRSLIESNRAPQIDPLAQSLAITEKLTNMAVAMRSGQPSGVAIPANDPNAMMTQMMTMMMTSMMKKFISGFDGATEKKEESSDWMKTIADLAKPLLEAKAATEKTLAAREQRMLRHEAAPAPAPPPLAESDASAPKPSTDQKPDPKENDMKLIAMLTEFLPMVVDNFAAKDADPASVAKLTMDNLPEDDAGLNDALYQLIQSPPEEFLAKLATMEPRVKEHAAWLEKFRLALLGEFDPDEKLPQVQK